MHKCKWHLCFNTGPGSENSLELLGLVPFPQSTLCRFLLCWPFLLCNSHTIILGVEAMWHVSTTARLAYLYNEHLCLCPYYTPVTHRFTFLVKIDWIVDNFLIEHKFLSCKYYMVYIVYMHTHTVVYVYTVRKLHNFIT